MKRKNKVLLICIVLILMVATVPSYLYLNSGKKESVKVLEKTNKFQSISQVLTAKIYDKHVGPRFREDKNVFYFDLDMPEHRKAVTNILNWLNADNVQISEGELKEFFGFGGYSPTFINIKFKDGTFYGISVDGQNLIITGYEKDKSLIVSNCADLVQFINIEWESLKQGMKAAKE